MWSGKQWHAVSLWTVPQFSFVCVKTWACLRFPDFTVDGSQGLKVFWSSFKPLDQLWFLWSCLSVEMWTSPAENWFLAVSPPSKWFFSLQFSSFCHVFSFLEFLCSSTSMLILCAEKFSSPQKTCLPVSSLSGRCNSIARRTCCSWEFEIYTYNRLAVSLWWFGLNFSTHRLWLFDSFRCWHG